MLLGVFSTCWAKNYERSKDGSTKDNILNFLNLVQLSSTDYYEVGKTRRAFGTIPPPETLFKTQQDPSRKEKKNGRYLFEYELCMLFGVFSTCLAKFYERSEGCIYKI